MATELHEEIKVAQFWRGVIGVYEYVNYDPADLLRWYQALETRGPDEIRAYLNERAAKHPMKRLLGLVAKPPHPPMEVVMLWLEERERHSSSASVWMGVGGFVTLCFLLGVGFVGCQNLKNQNTLALKPGQTSPPLMQPQTGQAPQSAATFPNAAPQTMRSSPSSSGTSTSDGAPAAHH